MTRKYYAMYLDRMKTLLALPPETCVMIQKGLVEYIESGERVHFDDPLMEALFSIYVSDYDAQKDTSQKRSDAGKRKKKQEEEPSDEIEVSDEDVDEDVCDDQNEANESKIEQNEAKRSKKEQNPLNKNKNKNKNQSISAPAHTREDSDDGFEVVLDMPLQNGGYQSVIKAQVDEWQTQFPTVDVMTQLKKARAWFDNNPERHVDPGRLVGFIVKWLNNAVKDYPSHNWRSTGSHGSPAKTDGDWSDSQLLW